MACLAIVLCTSCGRQTLSISGGIRVMHQNIILTKSEVPVDVYVPEGVEQAPTLVIAHGFSRSRANMAGWGSLLASNGFIAVVPNLPSWADHQRNGQALSELLDRVNRGEVVREPRPNGAGGLMGFSAGGLSSLLAASSNRSARCWVGLDPVDLAGLGTNAAKSLDLPCVVLQAEPAAWNAQGNSSEIVRALPGPMFALRVADAVHVDAEDPTDWLAELACGRSDPLRRNVFELYAVAAVRAVFFGDRSSLKTLADAKANGSIKDVKSRQLDAFLGKNVTSPASRPLMDSAAD
jgi:dienelactone hydrolase